MKLDIIIPCYNAVETLERAVKSCLNQTNVHAIYLIDDASTDDTWYLMQQLAQQFESIKTFRLPENSGAAMARNWGAMHSQADIIAFLDADDEYQPDALLAPMMAFEQMDFLGLIRLRVQAVDLPEYYHLQKHFNQAWRTVMMTFAGNTIFRRVFFLACGGFPNDALFHQLGGEDGALGLATVGSSVVGTLFDETEPAVLHYWREGIHAAYLLDAQLFGTNTRQVTAAQLNQANAITKNIQQQLNYLKTILNVTQHGTMPIQVSRQ